jgi:leader peptidase (prepilin peptidase) / N-methyltransferase
VSAYSGSLDLMPAHVILVIGLAGSAGGVGWLLRRNLDSLAYRHHDDRVLRRPRPRHWVPVVATAAVGALTWAFLPSRWPVLLIVLPAAVGGVWLAAVDLDVHRLPDAVLLPLIGWVTVAVGAVSLLTPNVSILTAPAGALGLGGFFWAMNLLSAGRLGFGDVKAAFLLGGLVGSLWLPGVWWTGMLAFVGALVATVARRCWAEVALGPWLFGAALLVLVVFGSARFP